MRVDGPEAERWNPEKSKRFKRFCDRETHEIRENSAVDLSAEQFKQRYGGHCVLCLGRRSVGALLPGEPGG